MTTKEENMTAEAPEVHEEAQAEVLEHHLEQIQPSVSVRQQKVGPEIYVQAPLSFIGKMRLSTILGRAIRRAMESGGGPALASLFGSSEEEITKAVKDGDTPISAKDLGDAATFLEAVGVLMEYVPDILLDVYVLALNVPPGEQEWAKETMALRADEGGLSDSDGMEILQTFVDQNWEALKSFFEEQILPLVQRFGAGATSPRPRPSRATRRSTPKQSKSSSAGRGSASK